MSSRKLLRNGFRQSRGVPHFDFREFDRAPPDRGLHPLRGRLVLRRNGSPESERTLRSRLLLLEWELHVGPTRARITHCRVAECYRRVVPGWR